MAEQNGTQPVIIKKVKKSGHAAHGGAWKVAYADFVTAMMAFFLLLWLLNAVTQEQLEGISNYFAPVSASQSTSGAGGVLGGKSLSEEGAMPASSSRPSVSMSLPPPKAGTGTLEEEGQGEASPEEISDKQAQELVKKKEQEQFEDAMEQLRQAIQAVPSMKNVAESLLIDNTPEGLRIQIVDQEGLAMFPSGSAEMYLHTKKVLELVAEVVKTMPQKLAISGHTDATKFAGGPTGYTNWELSADRANAARRYLVHLGVPDDRIKRVVGKADTDPLKPKDPTHPTNRRLSIVMLRGSADKKLAEEVLPGLNKAKERVANGDQEAAGSGNGQTQNPPAAEPAAEPEPADDAAAGESEGEQHIIIPLKPVAPGN